MGFRPRRIHTPNSQIGGDVLKQMEMIFHDVRKNTMQSGIKNKAHYDGKNQCLETQRTIICVRSTP